MTPDINSRARQLLVDIGIKEPSGDPPSVAAEYVALVTIVTNRMTQVAAEARGVAFWPPEADFHNCAHVRTIRGAEWEGHICGWYRAPPLTPLGYAVMSNKHKGAVQIYDENRLELVEPPK